LIFAFITVPIFDYTARDRSGKYFKGTVESVSAHEAAALIRERSLYITRLTLHQKSLFSKSFSTVTFSKVSRRDITNLTRQLATMINAGLQLQEALTLLKSQTTNVAFAEMLNKISREIQGGGNLASALELYKHEFSPIYIALVRAGEASGTLDRVLLRLAENMEKDQEFRGKVKGAMVYPVIILSVMILVFEVLMIVVVPKLTDLYDQFGADLPIQTRILQALSKYSVKFWWLGLILLFLGFVAFKRWRATLVGRRIWDGMMLKIPLLGTLQKQIVLVEFTRTLGMLVGAGVHILDALNILVETMGNIHYQEALKEITKKVEKGFPLGVLFAQYPIFPPLLAQMVKVGEETGKMDDALMRISIYFERESEQTVKSLTTAIEPLMMVILGVGVGLFVYAVITPIYNLVNQFK